MNPSANVTPDQIQQSWVFAETVTDKWPLIKDAVTAAEFDSYEDELLSAIEGLNKVKDYIDAQIIEWRGKRVPIAGKIDELESLVKRNKNKFFRAREQEKGIQSRNER